MSSNELLLRIKGDSSGGTKAVAETRAAIASLRTSSTANFSAISAATKAPLTGFQNLTNITQVLGASTAALQGPLGGVAGRLGSIGTLAREAGTGIGAAGAAVAAFTVVAGAAVVGLVALGSAIFDLAKSTADYAGKLFDLSAQTNFTVETLSALSLAAKTSGGNIDTVASALAIFQVNMVKAAEGNKEAAATFRELKIDTDNQEKALRQAMAALFAMGQTEEQSAKAKELFGKSGRVVLGIIKDTNGNLDEAIEKYTKMNLLVSTEAAAAADAFSDSLDLLNEQLAGVGRTIGFAVIPVLNVFFQDMSNGLAGNVSEWATWGSLVRNEVAGVLGIAQALASLAKEGFSIGGFVGLAGQSIANQASLLQRAQGESAAMTVAAMASRASLMSGGPRRTGGGGAGGGGKTARDTALQDAKTEAALVEREALKATEFDIMENKRSLDGQLRDLEEFTRRAIELADQKHDAAIARINSEQEALDQALAKGSITKKEHDIEDRELTLRNDKARREHDDEENRLLDAKNLKTSEAEIAARKRADDIAEDADQRRIQRIKANLDRGVLLESVAEKQIAKIIDEGFQRRKEALEAEENQYATSLERRKDINAELIRLDGDRTFAAEEAARRIRDARDLENSTGIKTGGDMGEPGVLIPPELLEPPPPPNFDPWKDAFAQVKAIGLDAMGSLAQGIGQMVQNWVLLGTAGPNAVRKMVAGVLAALAAQAAVEALMELARGFAALANPFMAWTAPLHFKAAAMFGLVAAGSAIAGRLIAGNSFQSESGGAGGSGGGGGSSSAPAAKKNLAPRDIDRNNFAVRAPIEETVIFRVKGDAIVDEIVRDFDLNGRTRIIIRNA